MAVRRVFTPQEVARFAAKCDGLEREMIENGFLVAARGVNRAKNAMGWEAAGDMETAGKAIAGELDRYDLPSKRSPR